MHVQQFNLYSVAAAAFRLMLHNVEKPQHANKQLRMARAKNTHQMIEIIKESAQTDVCWKKTKPLKARLI